MPDSDPKTPMSSSPPETSYEEVAITPADSVAKQWKSTVVNGDLVFSGDCPRCAHRWEKAIPAEVVVMAFDADVPASKDEGVHVVRCNCTHPHPDRPDGVDSGCGAYWGIHVRRPATGGNPQ